METPPFLVEQFAAEHKMSTTMAKRVLYLQGLDTTSRKVVEVAVMLGVAPSTLKELARKLLMDFADYRPYAKRRDAGEKVLPFKADIHKPASELPMFGGQLAA